MGRDYPPATCCAFTCLLQHQRCPPAFGFLQDALCGVGQQGAREPVNRTMASSFSMGLRAAYYEFNSCLSIACLRKWLVWTKKLCVFNVE
ncbi:MAG: hypothetical protein ABI642_12500 [Polaromonas sp.]